jgi:hypothetical protein
MVTISPTACVKPCPGRSGPWWREHRAQEKHEAIRILVIRPIAWRDEIERVAADHPHRARAFERETLATLDAHRELAAAHVIDAEARRRRGG